MPVYRVVPTRDLFQQVLQNLEPSDAEITQAHSHAESIRSRLAASFELRKFVVVGSHSRGTAIRSSSDVDYFAVLSRREATRGDGLVTSGTLLGRVRDDLSERFRFTSVHRDKMAIVVEFGGGSFNVDVVPAIFDEFQGKHPVYLMPDGQDDWMQTSPEAHNRLIAEAEARSGYMLKRIARLMKFWRDTRGLRLSSFYVELVLERDRICVGPISYGEALAATFEALANYRGINDPIGVSGTIHAVATSAQLEKLVGAAEKSAERARKALDFESRDRLDKAIPLWDLVFNNKL